MLSPLSGIVLDGMWLEPRRETTEMKLIEKPQIQEHLEMLIDRHSLNFILNSIAQISFEKSDHVQSTWQDKALASQWDKAGQEIESIADNNENL